MPEVTTVTCDMCGVTSVVPTGQVVQRVQVVLTDGNGNELIGGPTAMFIVGPECTQPISVAKGKLLAVFPFSAQAIAARPPTTTTHPPSTTTLAP